MKKMKLTTKVNMNEINTEIAQSFDYEFNGEVTTEIKDFNLLKVASANKFGIGLIVGPSGSGKSTIAKNLGLVEGKPNWNDNESICSHFLSVEDAQDKLGAVGLNSIPSWMKPYSVLSTGEKFRADLAASLHDGAFIDEFTSVVDRNVARACAKSIRKYVDRSGLSNIVFASCHRDIIEWLQPDWVYDTATGDMHHRGLDRQFPEIELTIEPCGWKEWAMFSEHHYLDAKVNKASWCWLVKWGGVIVGFASALAFPSGTVKNAWRGHRTVVLPDYQGLGIGVKISDAIAKMMVDMGRRYFSKTSHVRMGEYRERSPLWRPTSKNKKRRPDYASNRATKEAKYKHKHENRLCYSHEYMGTGQSS